MSKYTARECGDPKDEKWCVYGEVQVFVPCSKEQAKAEAARLEAEELLLKEFDTDRTFLGKILAIEGEVVSQSLGRGEIKRHLISRLELSPPLKVDDVVKISYRNGRGIVTGKEMKVERGGLQ